MRKLWRFWLLLCLLLAIQFFWCWCSSSGNIPSNSATLTCYWGNSCSICSVFFSGESFFIELLPLLVVWCSYSVNCSTLEVDFLVYCWVSGSFTPCIYSVDLLGVSFVSDCLADLCDLAVDCLADLTGGAYKFQIKSYWYYKGLKINIINWNFKRIYWIFINFVI